MTKKREELSDFESAFGPELKKLPLPDITFTAAFEQEYGQKVLNFAAAVHAMARNGDSMAISEAIKAVSWIFAGAGEIVRTQRKSRVN